MRGTVQRTAKRPVSVGLEAARQCAQTMAAARHAMVALAWKEA